MKMRLLVPLIALLLGFKAQAFDPQEYMVSRIDINGALSSNSVLCLVRDHRGFLWIGTEEGLDRWDGYELTHIHFTDECKGYDAVRCMLEDDSGKLWVGSFSGIAIYDPDTGQMAPHYKGSVSSFVKSKDGAIWVAAQYGGYLHIDPVTLQCDTLKYEYHNASAHFGSGICYDGDEHIYYINGVGSIYRSSLKDRDLELILPYQESPFNSLNVSKISYINGWLVGGVVQKTICYNLETGEVKYKSWAKIWDSMSLESGEYMLAMDNSIRIVDKDLNLLYSYKPDSPLLSTPNARCLCRDANGGILFGTASKGIWRFNRNHFHWKTFNKSSKGEKGVNVSTMALDMTGTIWAIGSGEGLMRLDEQNGTLENVELPVPKNVNSLGFVGKYMMVGVNSLDAPLYGIDLATGRTETFDFTPPLPVCFFDQGEGQFLMGSSGRLCQVDLNSRSSVRLEQVRTTTNKLIEYDGSIWAATSFNGLWEWRDGKWKHYTDSCSVSMFISDIISGNGGLWLATKYHGLQFLDTETGDVTSWDRFGDVPCTRLKSIASDAKGRLWICTTKGLAAFDPQSGRSAMFTDNDLFGKGTIVWKVNYSHKDGRIYVGTSDGIVSFDPQGMWNPAVGQEKIVFTGLKHIHILEQAGAENERDLGPTLDSKAALKFNAKDNSFVISVSDMNYSSPRMTRLVYKLEGYNDDWVAAPKGKIVISSLPYGSYILKVRIMDRYGVLRDAERRMPITIKRPLMASPVMILAYLLMLILLVYLIVMYFRGKVVREARESARIAEEKRIAENEKRLYASKLEFLMNIAHEIRTPLTLVRAPVETLNARLADTGDSAVKEDLGIISRNSEVLSNMLDELMDFKKLENDGYRINPAEEDVSALVNAVFHRFSNAFQSRKLHVDISLPAEPLIAAVDRGALEKIVGNLLSNAMKYAQEHIAISLVQKTDSFVLTTENDGESVPQAERERIFLPFERCAATGSKSTGTGIGLYVSRNLAELHNGTLAMDEDLSVNRFILEIPITHLSKPAFADLESISGDGLSPERRTVILVEDNDEMRQFIARQFPQDYNVVQFPGGTMALSYLQKNVDKLPDIVISDVMMPQMDGYELCHRIKSDNYLCVIPVMLLTARADVESRVSGWEIGADAYVTKPFSAAELTAQVGTIIDNKRRLHKLYLDSGDIKTFASSNPSEQTKFLRKIDDYLNDNLDKVDIDVAELASVVFMSESSLFKKMKNNLGLGPGEYILLTRLKKAAQLLRSSTMSIAEISERVGFRSHSSFSTAFKKQFGRSPKEYRSKGARTS